MARVLIDTENLGEGSSFEKLPENVRALVVNCVYERVSRPEGKTRDGRKIEAQVYTAHKMTCSLPDSEDPNKLYVTELKCGKYLLPSDDCTYLDDRECTGGPTDPSRKLNRQTGQAVFLASLVAAGREDGTYTRENELAVSADIRTLEGMIFHTAYANKDGGSGIGQYKALIATRIYQFGTNNPDLDDVIAAINKVLAAKGASLPVDVMKNITGLTASQKALAQNCLNDKTWLGQLYVTDATGKISSK